MMFKKIIDINKIENNENIVETGFGFIKDEIHFTKQKILKNKTYTLFGIPVKGFEIHNGISKKENLFYKKNHISGSFVHGVFNNNNFTNTYMQSIYKNYKNFDFQQYKEKEIDDFVNEMEKKLDIKKIIKHLS